MTRFSKSQITPNVATLASLIAAATPAYAQEIIDTDDPFFAEDVLPGQLSFKLTENGADRTNLATDSEREGDIDVATVELVPRKSYLLSLAQEKLPAQIKAGMKGRITFMSKTGNTKTYTFGDVGNVPTASFAVPEDAIGPYKGQIEVYETNAVGKSILKDIDHIQGRVVSATAAKEEALQRVQTEKAFKLEVAKKTATGGYETVDLISTDNANQRIAEIDKGDIILLYSPEFKNDNEAHFRDDGFAEPVAIEKAGVNVGKKTIGRVEEDLVKGKVTYTWEKPIPQGFETNDGIELAFPESGQYRVSAILQLKGEFQDATKFDQNILSIIVGGQLDEQDTGYHLTAKVADQEQKILQESTRVGNLEVKLGKQLALSIDETLGEGYTITHWKQIDPRGAETDSAAPTKRIDLPAFKEEGTWRFEIAYQKDGQRPETDVVNIKAVKPAVMAWLEQKEEQIPPNQLIYTQPSAETVAQARKEVEVNNGQIPIPPATPAPEPTPGAVPLPPPDLSATSTEASTTVAQEISNDTGYNLEARVNAIPRSIVNERLDYDLYAGDLLRISCKKISTTDFMTLGEELGKRLQYPNGQRADITEDVFEIPRQQEGQPNVLGEYIFKLDCHNVNDEIETETLFFTVKEKASAIAAAPAPTSTTQAATSTTAPAPIGSTSSTPAPAPTPTAVSADDFNARLHDSEARVSATYLNTTLEQEGTTQKVRGARSSLFINPAITLGKDANGVSLGGFWQYDKTRFTFTEGLEGQMQENQHTFGVTVAGHYPLTVEFQAGYRQAKDQANIQLSDQNARFNQRKRGVNAKLNVSGKADLSPDLELMFYNRTEVKISSRAQGYDLIPTSTEGIEAVQWISGDNSLGPFSGLAEVSDPRVRLQEYAGVELQTGVVDPYLGVNIRSQPHNETRNTTGVGFELGADFNLPQTTPLGPIQAQLGVDILPPGANTERGFSLNAGIKTDYLKAGVSCGTQVTIQPHEEERAFACGGSLEFYLDAPHDTERR